MADGTSIEWTDATLNVINGCSVVSPGCTNCYAMKQAHRFDVRRGLTQPTKGGMVWTGDVRFNEKALLQPLRWRRPRMIFWNAHGDTFHENVPDEWIDKCFAVMALTPHHTHQVLTKRPERMRDYLLADRRDEINSHAGTMMHWDDMPERDDWPMSNVWLGTSVEDQKRADERIPLLLQAPAAVRWLSMEPLLGPVDLSSIDVSGHEEVLPLGAGWLDRLDAGEAEGPKIDWIVLGGESGPKARPMHPAWARSIRDQCAAAGVPFHFKQWGQWKPFLGWTDGVSRYADASGSYGPGQIHIFGDGLHAARVGKKDAGRLLDGVEHDGLPGRVAA